MFGYKTRLHSEEASVVSCAQSIMIVFNRNQTLMRRLGYLFTHSEHPSYVLYSQAINVLIFLPTIPMVTTT